MSERRLARDPLADLLDADAGAHRDDPGGTPQRPVVARQQGSGKRDRITVQVDRALAEQVRDAVMWLHRVGVHTTISAIAGAGLRAELDRLADAHNDFRPFPPRRGEVPVGRPPRP